MLILLVVVLGVCAEARVDPKCSYSAWGAWGTCVSSRQCPVINPVSFQSEPQVWDTTRLVMAATMQQKIEHNEMKAACRRNPDCRDYDRRPSTGAYPCVTGYAHDTYECNNVDLLSFTNFNSMGYNPAMVNEDPAVTSGSDIWGWTDPIDGEEYALMAISGATSFTRVDKDSGATTPVGILYSHNEATIWRDVKTIGHYAFIVSEALDHGLQVFDLSQLRGLGASNPVRVFQEDAFYGGFGQSHNIVANEETGYLYNVGSTGTQEDGRFPLTCSGGLFAIDVNDPLNPTYAGCYGTDGYTHDAQCVIYHGPDQQYQGKEICFAYNENSLSIIDVSIKSNMQLVSRSEYAGSQYTHQGWLTEDHAMLLLDDELDEIDQLLPEDRLTKTFLWDIEMLSTPVLKRKYIHSQECIDHNQYVVGDYTYQMNYESGLRILRIDQNNYDLELVAFFDLFDLGTGAYFNGGWSVYPYFDSTNIVLSSMEYGLFVVRPDWGAINAAPAALAEETRVRVSMDDNCPDAIERRTCPETLQC